MAGRAGRTPQPQHDGDDQHRVVSERRAVDRRPRKSRSEGRRAGFAHNQPKCAGLHIPLAGTTYAALGYSMMQLSIRAQASARSLHRR
jgi:hypothetical protein